MIGKFIAFILVQFYHAHARAGSCGTLHLRNLQKLQHASSRLLYPVVAQTIALLPRSCDLHGKMDASCCVAYVTAPASVADRLASALVERRLVACVNIISGVTSVYRWQGAVQRDAECLLILKSSREQQDAVIAAVKELHTRPRSYSCPFRRGTHRTCSGFGTPCRLPAAVALRKEPAVPVPVPAAVPVSETVAVAVLAILVPVALLSPPAPVEQWLQQHM